MLEIGIYDADLNELETVTNFNALQWTRRLYECGGYKLILGGVFSLPTDARYIIRHDRNEIGIIDNFNVDKIKKETTISGYFFENLLNSRVINSTGIVEGATWIVLRILATQYAMTYPRGINKFWTGTSSGSVEEIQVQAFGEKLGEKMYEIAKSQKNPWRIDFEESNGTGTAYLKIWQGKDRTPDQSENSLAIFSVNEGNISELTYYKNTENYKNYAYVAGMGEGSERVVVEVDNTGEDEERYEVWIDASSITKEDLTDAEYEALLSQYGTEQLKDYVTIESVYFEVNPNSNLIYEADYDLGDTVTFQDDDFFEEETLEANLQITEITEILEDNSRSLNLVLGDENKTEVEKIKKEVV